MRSRVSVTIAGDTYTMVGEENEEYLRKVAALVDNKVTEIKKASHGISTMQAMALASCDIADDYLKAVESADNLRAQLKNYLEEAELLREELNDVRRKLGSK